MQQFVEGGTSRLLVRARCPALLQELERRDVVAFLDEPFDFRVWLHRLLTIAQRTLTPCPRRRHDDAGRLEPMAATGAGPIPVALAGCQGKFDGMGVLAYKSGATYAYPWNHLRNLPPLAAAIRRLPVDEIIAVGAGEEDSLIRACSSASAPTIASVALVGDNPPAQRWRCSRAANDSWQFYRVSPISP